MPAKKNFDKESIKKIHTILRELRERTETQDKKALSQRELANEIGVVHSRISKLEAIDDETEPSISDLLAYRSYFHVSIDYLLGLEIEPTIDSDIKQIANEYGISSRALANIKKVTGGFNHVDIDDYEYTYCYALNTILESYELELFLKQCIKYFNFYPSSEEYTYVWTGTPEPFVPKSDEDDYYEICIKANADDFFDYPNMAIITSKDFDDILWNSLKTPLSFIKKSSYNYYKNNIEELKRVEQELAKYTSNTANSDFIDDTSFGVIERKLNYLKNIKHLKEEIEKYKHNNHID